MSFRTAAFSDGKWLGSWTIFYWAWWVSRSPFVSVSIARISKGRTIREFVIVVLLIPSGVTFLWFTIMGGTALHSELVGLCVSLWMTLLDDLEGRSTADMHLAEGQPLAAEAAAE